MKECSVLYSLIPFKDEQKCLDLINQKIKSFDTKQPTIVFIEPYGSITSLIQYCFNKSYNLIVLTAQVGLRKSTETILSMSQLSIKIDTTNEYFLWHLISLLKQKIIISAVIPGFEYFVPIVSKINNWLSLPSISSNTVMNFRRKDLMRIELQKANLTVPNFYILHSMNELERAINLIGFPIICKPSDAAGSVYVKKVNNYTEAKQAVEKILHSNEDLWGHHLNKCVLLEEYIAGKEYSVEGVIQNDVINFFSVTEKIVADQNEFIEIGHIVNSPLTQKIEQDIKTYITKILHLLGANYCPFHAELRLNVDDQPVLMEIAARLAGDKIADLICLGREVNYLEQVMNTYLGLPILPNQFRQNYAGIRFFYRPDVNSYEVVQGENIIDQYPIHEFVLYYQQRQLIPAFPKALRRLGHVVMQHTNYSYLLDALNKIDLSLVFKTES